MKNMRDISKKDWVGSDSIDYINAGSLQRIADAVEKMAVNHDNLVISRDQALKSAEYWRGIAMKLERRNAALRGVITRMTNRNKKVEV